MRSVTGITVFAGMLGVTLFGLFLTPVFYVALRKLVTRRARRSCSAELPLEVAHALSSEPCDALSLAVVTRDGLAACAVGPDYVRPEVPVPGAFRPRRRC